MNFTVRTFDLWHVVPFQKEEIPKITVYLPEEKNADCAVAVFAGGGYWGRSEHEGNGYAEFFAENGITAFVVDYRLRDDKFPAPLLDARRSVQFIRYYAEKFGIDKKSRRDWLFRRRPSGGFDFDISPTDRNKRT